MPGQQCSQSREPKAVSYATGRHGRGCAKTLLQAAFTLFSYCVTFLGVGEFTLLFLAAVPLLRLLILPIVLLKSETQHLPDTRP